jgi:hypothetical protein
MDENSDTAFGEQFRFLVLTFSITASTSSGWIGAKSYCYHFYFCMIEP